MQSRLISANMKIPAMGEKFLSEFIVAVFVMFKTDLKKIKDEGPVIVSQMCRVVHFLANVRCELEELANLLSFATILLMSAKEALESVDVTSGNYMKPSKYPSLSCCRRYDPARVESTVEKLRRFEGHFDESMKVDLQAMISFLGDIVGTLSYDEEFCSLT